MQSQEPKGEASDLLVDMSFVECINKDLHRCVVHLGAVMVLHLLVLIEDAEVPGSFTQALAGLTDSAVWQPNKFDSLH